jgi:hypothetical protein
LFLAAQLLSFVQSTQDLSNKKQVWQCFLHSADVVLHLGFTALHLGCSCGGK